MTITVEIKPEVQAELARQAAARGRALEAHHLMELFEPNRGLLTDEEVDTLFSRKNGRAALTEPAEAQHLFP